MTELDLDIESSGHNIHITRAGAACWTVCLNTEIQHFDGLVVGVGQTIDEAKADAVHSLRTILEALEKAIAEAREKAP